MSPQKQRIAIAIACGWTDTQIIDGKYGQTDVPDYLGDLNACHEMEKVLTHDQHIDYMEWLGLCSDDYGHKVWAYVHATATERCKAFLRTLGLWEKEANTTKSVSPTSPATEESSVTLTSGNESDFVTKSMTADEIMAGKMAKDLHQIREQIDDLGKYQTNLLGGGGWDTLVRMDADAERLESHLRRRWNTPTQPQ